MSEAITPAATADMRDFLRCSQLLAQLLDHSPTWVLCGLRWSVQRFHYCCPVEPDYGTKFHQHDYLEINLLCKGRLQFRTADHAVAISPGDVYFITPRRKHTWDTVHAPVVIAGFHIRVSVIDKSGHALLKALNDRIDRGAFNLRKAAAFSRVHQNIWELIHQDPPSPLVADKLRALFELFAQEMIEHAVPSALLTAPMATPIIGPDTIATSRYEQIVDFVHQNINQPIRLDDIAHHFDYSVRHVARLFRRESGVALGQYILEQKLRTAQRMLATTDYSVKNIAIDLGFHDVGYFCRLFRTHLMGTPNGYRTQVLAGRTASPDSPGGHHNFRGFFRACSQHPPPIRDSAA